ncbi:Uncharacterized protein FWK35_00019399 [Aphis craccivora]|uniref:Uncharacterized protein n=1 Tax=Aphis craccivora TaxID=307492 RepID=A0A6G0YM01_APHCR|nr:Uncharacterized protein FWK35_00019399 [Aphis craccivora]
MFGRSKCKNPECGLNGYIRLLFSSSSDNSQFHYCKSRKIHGFMLIFVVAYYVLKSEPYLIRTQDFSSVMVLHEGVQNPTPAYAIDSERSEKCIDFTMIITSRNNAPISNYGDSFRCKSEYPWCIIEVKS